MKYKTEEIEQMDAALDEWAGRAEILEDRIIRYPFKNEKSRECAMHGLMRRLNMLQHTIYEVFKLLPTTGGTPSKSDVMTATAFLQTFIMNVYGSMDNLARIWLLDAKIVERDGEQIRPEHIGLGPKNKNVRTSLPVMFQEYLSNTDGWFGYLANYRHAFAHKIPLYIPPKTLNNEQAAEHQNLESKISNCLKTRDWERYDEVRAQQSKLGVFQPVMMHSYGENARPMWFHAQMICDYSTVVEVGEYTFDALESLPI